MAGHNLFFHFGLAVLFGLGALQAHPARAQTLTLGADQWCPFNCEPDSSAEGIMVDVARAALEPAGYTVKYVNAPWSRALSLAEKGEIQGVIGAVYEDAPTFVFPQRGIGATLNAVAKRTGMEFNYTGPDSLKSFGLGAIQDYAYNEEINSYIENYKSDKKRVNLLTGDTALSQGLRLVLAGRLDLFIDSGAVLQYEIKSSGLTSDLSLVPLDEPEPLFIAFSPAFEGAQAAADALDKGIAELEASGALAAIKVKYGLEQTVVMN